MASNIKECPVHSYVRSDESLEHNLPLLPACAIKVESEALDMDTPNPVIQVPEIYIKQEPENENLDITVKEEPFLYGSQKDADVSAPASAAGDTGRKRRACRDSIRESPEPPERRVYRVKKRLEKPEIINAWLKKNRLKIKERIYLRKQEFDKYDTVFRHLIKNKDAIKSHQKTLFRDAIKFGYFLQLMFENQFEKSSSKYQQFSYETILSEHIGINKVFAQNLQWLGKLGYQYPKLGNVSLYLYQVFKKKKAINNLFQNFPDLANWWIV
ncbi:uncharacterized protein LOC108668212 isoform X2 [Hyalella azteca]|uniref:Uncharacterized protein LOC108668212 isoform X2 n=1 Tax=Hyalella azteca TaxID=294128 RepID=A0A8B7NBC1_HYAAZ|nr:uncharacterized protein LOC108668212 isoform X2 [Hyalella azteca]